MKKQQQRKSKNTNQIEELSNQVCIDKKNYQQSQQFKIFLQDELNKTQQKDVQLNMAKVYENIINQWNQRNTKIPKSVDLIKRNIKTKKLLDKQSNLQKKGNIKDLIQSMIKYNKTSNRMEKERQQFYGQILSMTKEILINELKQQEEQEDFQKDEESEHVKLEEKN